MHESRGRRGRVLWFLGFITVVFSVMTLGRVNAEQDADLPAMDPDDISGIVRSDQGPEGGVWVIAETDDLPTKFRKIVVTDAQGRFVLPDLPRAAYRVWARGYGLVDSEPVDGTPGQGLRLTARVASSPQEAAKIYPPDYWYSLIEVPGKDEFPGTGPEGNGISPNLQTQAEWISAMKLGCSNCHQMGNGVMRSLAHLPGTYSSGVEAWTYRMGVGQRKRLMLENMEDTLGTKRALQMFADWTDRIAAGEVPPQPPRPQGLERNVVLTSWDWGSPTSIIHDLIAADKREPTVNANGLVYGLDYGRDRFTILDPIEGRSTEIPIPVRDEDLVSGFPQSVPRPSPYWGEEVIWTNRANPAQPDA